MSFAINPSLNHINVPVAYIEAFYRSTSEVPLPDARFRGRPCEAFICITKIEKAVKAYVAILDNGLKSVLVYTSDYEVSNPADYSGVYARAEEFVKAMGFTMEAVNLDFSPAMREVIIKGFRVMRPPPPPPPRKQGKAPKAVFSADHHLLNVPAQLEDALHREFQIDELPAELASLRAELASARTVIEKITREKVSAERSAMHEINSLKTAVEQANDARKASEEKLAQELRTPKAGRMLHRYSLTTMKKSSCRPSSGTWKKMQRFPKKTSAGSSQRFREKTASLNQSGPGLNNSLPPTVTP